MKNYNILLFASFIILFVFVDTTLTIIGTNEPFNYEELNPIFLLTNMSFLFMVTWKIILSIIILAITLQFTDRRQTILISIALLIIVIVIGLNTLGIAIKIPEIL